MKLIRLFFILMALNFAACQETRQFDPLNPGLERLDKGDFDGAIQYFEQLNQTSPSSEVRIALASAYAGRAGVHVSRFWNFGKELRGNQITPESLAQTQSYQHNEQNLAPLRPLLPAETQSDVEQMFLTMSALEIYRHRFEIYPYAQKENRNDLRSAVNVLTSETDAGERLYRAALNGVIVRSELDDGFNFWNSLDNQFADLIQHPLEFNRVFCTPVTGDLTVWMGEQLGRTQLIASDLSFAYPADAEQYAAFSAPVGQFSAQIPQLQSGLLPQGCNP